MNPEGTFQHEKPNNSKEKEKTTEMLSLGTEKIMFTPLKEFPTTNKESKKITYSKDKVFEGNFQGDTYKNTVEIRGWEGQLMEVMKKYLQTEKGKNTAQRLKIESLEILSPQQAILFTLTCIRHLTKYSFGDITYEKGKEMPKKSRPDKTTAIDLLKEGIDNYEDGAWDGNGVCRNFADMVELVFQALKVCQKETGLINTYCCTYGGWDFEERNLTTAEKDLQIQVKKDVFRRRNTPHAWNAFTQVIAEEEVHVGVADVTWSKEHETYGVTEVDYTEERSEPFAYRGMQNYGENEQVREGVIAYYVNRFNKLDGGGYYPNTKRTIEKLDYLAWRLLLALPPSLEPINTLPENFKKRVKKCLEESFKDGSTIFDWSKMAKQIKKATKMGVETSNALVTFTESRPLKELIKIKRVFTNGAFAAILEEISAHPNFKNEIEKNTKLRILVREVHPQMLRPFRPDRNESDLDELRLLIENSEVLHREVQKFLRNTKQKSSLAHMTCEDVAKIKEIVYALLTKRNPEKMKKIEKEVNIWNIIRNFNEYWREFKATPAT